MKEHESRKLKDGEIYFKYQSGELREFAHREYRPPSMCIIFVDSNNFVHRLDGFNYTNIYETEGYYFIHGSEYSKREWEIERNRLSMLGEI